MSSKDEGNNSVPMMPSLSKASDTVKTKQKAPKMMKGGIKDRPWFSWIRILLVTVLWWLLVFGFFSLCYFLTYEILYGSEDSQPYFVRDFGKYPKVLKQPGLNIEWDPSQDAGSSLTFKIGINRIYNWKPEVYTNKDNPEVEAHGRLINMKEDLKEMGFSSQLPDKLVFVTCSGKKEDDVAQLKGMKVIGKPGFSAEGFPWNGTKENWLKPIEIDLDDTVAAKDNTDNKIKVIMECRVWDKNVDLAVRQVDVLVPNGGALATLCFCHGRIIKTGETAFDSCT